MNAGGGAREASLCFSPAEDLRELLGVLVREAVDGDGLLNRRELDPFLLPFLVAV